LVSFTNQRKIYRFLNMITGETFEQRKEAALEFKQKMKESGLEFQKIHKDLTKEVGDQTATKLLGADVDSMTTIGGIYRRDVFINSVPLMISSIVKCVPSVREKRILYQSMPQQMRMVNLTSIFSISRRSKF